MGLLDGLLGGSMDDPRTAATLQLAQGLLSAPRAMQGLSGGLLGYQQQMAQAKQQEEARKLRELQLQQHQMQIAAAQRQAEQQKAQDAFRQSIPGPQMQAAQGALAGGGGPTMANAAAMPAVDPNAQFMHGAMQAGLIDPVQYMASQRKDTAPLKLGAGEGLYDPKTYKPLVVNPKEDTTPSAVKEYNFAKSQGYPGTFQQFQLEQKRAGASSVSVSMDKGFGDAFAKDAAGALAASRDQAKAAASNITTLDRINGVLDSGKVALGPTAKFETFGRQLAEAAGVGGKDNAEKLGNTRQLIQGAATLAADGAKLLAGQGQITEGERALILRAAGGDMDGMTAPEIRALSGTLRKINALKIESHQGQLKKVGPQFAPFVPFYNVDMPAAPESGGQWSIKPKG